jgi:ribose transport system ATP-binding protein
LKASGPAPRSPVRWAARPARPSGPREAADQGLTYLSEDRKGKGLHVDFGLRENLTLMALQRYAAPWLKPAAERAALTTAVADFGIRTGSPDCAPSSRAATSRSWRWPRCCTGPRWWCWTSPRAVDVGAKRDIYFWCGAGRRRGVVVISSELMELIGLCHRVA